MAKVAIIPEHRFKCHAVDGRLEGDKIAAFNDLYPDDFHPLERHHLERGYWFAIYIGNQTDRWVAFAGFVPFVPFPDVAYFKRSAVLPEYRGYGLQRKLMAVRESAARARGYTRLISSCDVYNIHSANNFIREGWLLTNPERPWEPTSLYWIKEL